MTSDTKKCNVFLEMFYTIFSDKQIIKINNDRHVLKLLELLDYFVQKPMDYITFNEIKLIIKKSPIKKAPGYNRFTNIMFKNLPKKELVFMTALFMR